jgi:Ubiquitin-2 like Rad60 SUMO-like
MVNGESFNLRFPQTATIRDVKQELIDKKPAELLNFLQISSPGSPPPAKTEELRILHLGKFLEDGKTLQGKRCPSLFARALPLLGEFPLGLLFTSGVLKFPAKESVIRAASRASLDSKASSVLRFGLALIEFHVAMPHRLVALCPSWLVHPCPRKAVEFATR